MEFTALREKTGLTVPEVATILGRSKRTVYNWESGTGGPRPAEIEKLRQARVRQRVRPLPVPKFRFIDLFAGIGGLRRVAAGIRQSDRHWRRMRFYQRMG